MMSGMAVIRTQIRAQNHWAAVAVQRVWRGHSCRRRLWAYGGEWYVFNVLRVQCAYRIRLALRAAVAKWHQKIARHVHAIHTLFFIWKANKLRKRIHAMFLKKCIIKLQSGFRRKIAMRILHIVRAIRRNRMAIRVQSFLRMFLGYRRALRRQKLRSLLIEMFGNGYPSHDTSALSSPSIDPMAFALDNNRADRQEAFLDYSKHSCEESLLRMCSVLFDVSLGANFAAALHKAQNAQSLEFIRRHQLDVKNAFRCTPSPEQGTSTAKSQSHSLHCDHRGIIQLSSRQSSFSSSFRLVNMDALPLISSSSQREPVEIFASLKEADADMSQQIAQQMSSLCTSTTRQVFNKWLLYFALSANWSKFGRTRQLHVAMLERCFGIIHQQLWQLTDKTLLREILFSATEKLTVKAVSASNNDGRANAEENSRLPPLPATQGTVPPQPNPKLQQLAASRFGASTRSVTFSVDSMDSGEFLPAIDGVEANNKSVQDSSPKGLVSLAIKSIMKLASNPLNKPEPEVIASSSAPSSPLKSTWPSMPGDKNSCNNTINTSNSHPTAVPPMLESIASSSLLFVDNPEEEEDAQGNGERPNNPEKGWQRNTGYGRGLRASNPSLEVALHHWAQDKDAHLHASIHNINVIYAQLQARENEMQTLQVIPEVIERRNSAVRSLGACSRAQSVRILCVPHETTDDTDGPVLTTESFQLNLESIPTQSNGFDVEASRRALHTQRTMSSLSILSHDSIDSHVSWDSQQRKREEQRLFVESEQARREEEARKVAALEDVDDVVLCGESSVRWKGFACEELLDVFFQLSTLPFCSRVRLFDALMFKVDVLLFLAFARLSHILHMAKDDMVESEVSAAADDRNFELNAELQRQATAVLSRTQDEAQSIAENQSQSTTSSAKRQRVSQRAAHFNYCMPYFAGYGEKDIILKQVLLRAFRLLSKAKSFLVIGSLDEFEFHYRFDYFHALNSKPICLFTICKEFVVKIVNVPLPMSYVNAMEAAQPLNVERKVASDKKPTKSPKAKRVLDNSPTKAKKDKYHSTTAEARPRTTNREELAICCQVRVLLSGNVLVVHGSVLSLDDIHPPPLHQQTNFCQRLMMWFRKLAAAKEVPALARTGSSSGNSNAVSARSSFISSRQSFAMSSGTLPTLASSSSKPTTARSNVTATPEWVVDESKSLFPLPLRSMILFPSEIHQLVTLFKSNYNPNEDEEEDNNSIMSQDSLQLGHNTSAQAIRKKQEQREQQREAEQRLRKKRARLRRKQARQEAHIDAYALQGYAQLEQLFPLLSDQSEDFVRFLVLREASVSLVFQQHVLAQVYEDSHKQSTTAPIAGAESMGLQRNNATDTSETADVHRPPLEAPPIIADDLEPLLRLHSAHLDHKRSQLLHSNDARYATLLLQRIYRGFCGRKRYAYVRKKHTEMLRKRWLAWKVLDKWKAMRLRHELAAIHVQSRFKGWAWRKLLNRMRFACLQIQCAVRIHRARKHVDEEKRRRDGGPQVIDMFPNSKGRVVSIHGMKMNVELYRCGDNYKMRAIDVVKGELFYGAIYRPELNDLLRRFNGEVISHFEANGELATSVACKQAQVFLWQHEKIADWLLAHLTLNRRIERVVNEFFLIPGEERDRLDRRNDLVLIVSLPLHLQENKRIASTDRTEHFLPEKLQSTNSKPTLESHPFTPFLKQIIHEEGEKMRLPGNSKTRKLLIQSFNSRQSISRKRNNRVDTARETTTSTSTSFNKNGTTTAPLSRQTSSPNAANSNFDSTFPGAASGPKRSGLAAIR